MGLRGFGSDNFSGVLPEVFKALEESFLRGRQVHSKSHRGFQTNFRK